jgi:hypothetical protein
MTTHASYTLSPSDSATSSFDDITRFSIDVRANEESVNPRILVNFSKLERRAKRLSSDSVIAFDVRSSRLSFDKISSRYRQQLIETYGDSARTTYETKVAGKMSQLLKRFRTRVPGLKIGIVGFPAVPSNADAGSFNQNYAGLLSEVDVFIPRLTTEDANSIAMETLLAMAGDRPIMSQGAQTAQGQTGSAGSGSPEPNSPDSNSAMSNAELASFLSSFSRQEAINMLQAAWGTASTTWDFNADGTVAGEDLAILLSYYSQNQDSDSGGSDTDNDSDDNGDDPDIDPDGNDGGNGSNDSDDDNSSDDNGDDPDIDPDGNDGGTGSNDSNGDSDDSNSDGSDNDGPGSNTDGEDQGGVDDSDIQLLVSGPGFLGNTSAPTAVGSPSSPGHGAKAIARWTELPFITRDQDFYITISAYHMTDIDRVEFILNGGDPVSTSEVQPHPETGYPEYMAKIDVSELTTGTHEIRAVIYPNHGKPRVLQGSHDTENIHVINNGNHSFWFNYDPAPRTVRVGPNSEFSTIDEAIETMGSLIIDGRIELEAGDYYWFTDRHMNLNNTIDHKVLTICAAPGVGREEIRIRRHMADTIGTKFLSVHLRGMTILPTVNPVSNKHARLLVGGGTQANRLFLEDIFCTSETDNPNGWGASYVQELAKPLVSWKGGVWVKGADFENLPKGVDTVYLAKHTTFHRASWDLWGGSPGSVFDCVIDKHDNFNAQHSNHADIIQSFVQGDYVENRIFADISATNHYTQIGHLEWSSKLSNFAFVRWTIDEEYQDQSLNFYPDFDHLVMSDCIFKNATVNFFNYNKHVLFRNVISYKYKGNAVQDVFDDSTMIIDNIHFILQRSGAPTWATYGEVTWASPSAPAGEPSDGSGDFVSSLVQSEAGMTDWSLGNPNTPMGDNNDHFYYDPRELDLTWWK